MSTHGVVIVGSPEPRAPKIELDNHGERWCRVMKVSLIDPGVTVMKKIRWERQTDLAVVDIR